MNVKTIFQILISILIIFLLYIFIKDTFLTSNKDIVDLDLDSNKNVEIKKDIVDPGTNLIEKLNYKSIDALGNEYLLSAETAEESKDDLNVLILKTVSGVIKLKDKSIIYINSDFAKKMLESGTISGGMIPKINTCIDAVKYGVTGVVIVDGRKPHSILFELFSDKGAGTLIRK